MFPTLNNTTSSANGFGISVKFSTGESSKWEIGYYHWAWPFSAGAYSRMNFLGEGYW